MGNSSKAITFFALLVGLIMLYMNYKIDFNFNSAKEVKISINIDKKLIKVDGKKIASDFPIYNNNGSIMIPINEIVQSMGGSFLFNKNTSAFTVVYNSIEVNGYLNNDYIYVDGEKQKLKNPPELKAQVVYVPEEFIVKAYGFKLENSKEEVVLVKEFVTFADINLERYLREYLNKQTGFFIKEELNKITKIQLDGKNIRNLEGIQYLDNLQILSLKNNSIEKIDSIKSLKKLKELYLENNNIRNISAVAECKSIENMDLSRNIISDVPLLSKLDNLKKINLSKNRISKSPIGIPANLEYLDISYNNIANTSSIKNGRKLTILNMENNPITNTDSLKRYKYLKVVNLWGMKDLNEVNNRVKSNRIKVQDYLKKHPLTQRNQYEKILVTYDTVLYNSAYIQNDGNEKSEYSLPESIFQNGGGNILALTRIIHIMLNLSGVESYNYKGTMEFEGGKYEHAWNIIKSGNQFYYNDIGMANILGIEQYGHTFFNVSQRQFLRTHPIAYLDKFTADEDSVTIDENYFRGWNLNKSSLFDYFSKGITKTDKNNITTSITTDRSSFVSSDEDFIYYKNNSDEGKLYKMKSDGSGKTKINDNKPAYIYNDKDYIYYINTEKKQNEDNGKIYSVSKKDGSSKVLSENIETTWMLLLSGKIYHVSINNAVNKYKLYKMDPDGENQEILVDDIIYNNEDIETFENYYRKNIFLLKNNIFYINESDRNSIYTVRVNGKNRKKLTEENSRILEVNEEFMYYKNSDGYFRVKHNGENKESLKSVIN